MFHWKINQGHRSTATGPQQPNLREPRLGFGPVTGTDVKPVSFQEKPDETQSTLSKHSCARQNDVGALGESHRKGSKACPRVLTPSILHCLWGQWRPAGHEQSARTDARHGPPRMNAAPPPKRRGGGSRPRPQTEPETETEELSVPPPAALEASLEAGAEPSVSALEVGGWGGQLRLALRHRSAQQICRRGDGN